MSHPSTDGSASKWLKTYMLAAPYRAASRGLDFTITAADVVLPPYCPFTLRPLKYGCRHGDRDGPALDRIMPSLGYVPGNVRVISLLAKTLRQDCLEPDVFRRLADDAERILFS